MVGVPALAWRRRGPAPLGVSPSLTSADHCLSVRARLPGLVAAHKGALLDALLDVPDGLGRQEVHLASGLAQARRGADPGLVGPDPDLLRRACASLRRGAALYREHVRCWPSVAFRYGRLLFSRCHKNEQSQLPENL